MDDLNHKENSHLDKTISGIKWSLVDKILSQGAGIVINLILARLLLPNDFGLLGMVVVIIGFAAVFKDFGLGSAIVQKKNIYPEDLSSVFWFNSLIGLLLTVIIYFSAPYIAGYYELPRLQPIAELLSITYIIGALNIVQLSLLKKVMNFRRLFIINSSATLLSGGVAIFLALLGYGVWSLVWKMILFSIVTNIVLWAGSSWRPRLVFSGSSLKNILGFSLPLLGTQSLNYWVRNADNLLIGKYIGDNALGLYNQSYRVMLIPVNQITGVLSNVLFPSFSQIQDDKERIKQIYLKVTRLLSFLTFPLMFGLCALAEPFVHVLLGEKWMAMVPVLQYLAVVGAFQSIGTLNGNVFQATGNTAYQLWIGLPVKIIVLGAIVLGISRGINQVAFNYMVVTPVLSFYLYYFMGRLINLRLIEIVANLLQNFVLSITMAFAVHYFFYFVTLVLGNFSGFILSLLLGVFLYSTLTYLFNKKVYSEVIAIIRDRF